MPRAARSVSWPLCGPGPPQVGSAGVCSVSEGTPVGTNETAAAGLTALSPSVLYPRSDPIHSCRSLVPGQMLSLPRFEHAFCCRKMKTMQPDVFLFLRSLPGAGAKCVAQVLGALLPGFSVPLRPSSRGRCSDSPARGSTSGHLQAQLPGKGADQGETHLGEHKALKPVQVSLESPPI